MDELHISSVTWGDVGGMEDAKEHIRQFIALPLRHSSLFEGK